MVRRKPKVVVVMPGYNVEATIRKTFEEIPKEIVSKIILVDDGSRDKTASIAKSLGITIFSHPHNLGYGGAQKTGYWEALKEKPDVVAMLHSDYQHDASFLSEIVEPVLKGDYDVMFGSRLSSRQDALSGGMPIIKYLINRFLTRLENFILGVDLSEHLCGFRAYSQKALKTIPYMRLSNGYVFDPQLEISAIALGLKIGETPIPTRYLKEAGSITVFQGTKLLFDIFTALFKFILFKWNIYKDPIFGG